MYQITAEGREHFRDQLTNMLSVPYPDPPAFAAAVSLLGHFPPAAATQALRTRATLLSGQIAELNAQLNELHGQLHRILLVELEYLLAARRAELGWTRSILADIANGKLDWEVAALLSGSS